MSCPIQKSVKILSLLIFSLLFCPSCSQNAADIKESSLTVIYDYNDEENLPSARLSLFIESESDTRRSQNILLSSLTDGYEWTAEELVHIKSGNRSWSGYTNFVMQKNQPFPKDSYSLVLRNADENEAVQTVELSYDDSFYDMTSSQADEKMKAEEAVKKVAIYDENGILLYYDVQNDNLNSARKMWNMFSNASYYKIVWQAKDGSTMCILPKRLVIPDEN